MPPSTSSEKKTTQPETNTAQARSGLARANLSEVTAKATATTTATQMDQVVPCSETYFMFAAVIMKYEGTSQKAVSPYASVGMAMAGRTMRFSWRVIQRLQTRMG